jgi:hypothetical protein
MKISTLFILTFITVAAHSQNTINSYKYVLVPQKFDFLRDADEYGLNTTSKSLLEQKGFTVYWSNGDIPQTLAANRCAALTAEVTQRKALFSTNLTLVLKDCSGNIIFKGKEGRSWEKEFNVAYDEALKNAFTSIKNLPYKYDSTQPAQSQNQAQAQTQTQTKPQAQSTTPPASVTTTSSPQTPASPQQTAADISGTLYAQIIPNGYQLIDTTPKKVLTLLKTSVPDCFLAEPGTGTPNGIVFKKNGEWFFESYKDDALVSQKLQIKF